MNAEEQIQQRKCCARIVALLFVLIAFVFLGIALFFARGDCCKRTGAAARALGAPPIVVATR